MRIFFALFILAGFQPLQAQVTPLEKTAAPAPKKAPFAISFRCERTFTGPDQPLLVIDGKIVPLATLSIINPNIIQSVTILKSAAATAIFGPDGNAGVLIIQTKKWEMLVVADQEGSLPLPGATLTVMDNRKKGIGIKIANKDGQVIMNEYNSYDSISIRVTAPGYLPVDTAISRSNGQPLRLLLSRIDNRKATELPFTIYPNPLRPGQAFRIVVTADNGEVTDCIITDATGRLLLQQKAAPGKVQTLATDSRWKAGLYFVQVHYANGRTSASGKIILQ